MKVAYLAPYYDGTGYGNSALEVMLAMDSVGIDVVPRSVKMTPKSYPVPDRVLELEKKDLLNVDFVIQHNLPSTFSYTGKAKNIGWFIYETRGRPMNTWQSQLGLMDSVFTSCTEDSFTLKTCYDVEKTQTIPFPVNSDKFHKDYGNPLGIPDKKCVFYTICEFTKRKDLGSLILSYMNSFDSSDDVLLVIKSGNGNDDLDAIKKLIENIRSGTRRFPVEYRYPKVLVISSRVSEDQLNSIHQNCHVFVSTSHGESFCLPALDALGFGNSVLASKCGAFKDYIRPDGINGVLVEGQYIHVFGAGPQPDNLYSSREKWFRVNTDEFSHNMRTFYDNIHLATHHQACADRTKYVEENYSYKTVGQLMLDKLARI